MLDITLEQGQQIFLKALAGNNFSAESIRAYNADITQFIHFLKSVRVDWNTPTKIQRLDIVEFMNRLAGLRRTGTTRARKLASLRHYLKLAFPVKTRNFVRWGHPRTLDEMSTLINLCF